MTFDETAIKEISDKYGLPISDIKAAIKIGMEYQQIHQRLVEEKKAKLVKESENGKAAEGNNGNN